MVLVPLFGAVGAALSVSIVYFILAVVGIFVYVSSTDAQLQDIIMLRKDDWNTYRMIFDRLLYRVKKKRRRVYAQP
jgi:Na+-driven multidrug efflux pump